MPFFAGKFGSVRINDEVMPLSDWSIDPKADAIDTSNFSGEGFTSAIYGLKSCDISASGPYDGNMPVGPGDGAFVVFELSTGGEGPVFIVNALLTSAKIDQNVKDVAKINYTAQNSGPFTITV